MYTTNDFPFFVNLKDLDFLEKVTSLHFCSEYNGAAGKMQRLVLFSWHPTFIFGKAVSQITANGTDHSRLFRAPKKQKILGRSLK